MAINIAFEKYTLPNGLDVILHVYRSIPVAAVNVWYHVGSQNEEPDRTGFAHLFEHIMFRGSKHHDKEYFGPLQEVGANINGSTTTDRTNYYEDVPTEYLELALWLESDRMGYLLDVLDQAAFDVERDVVKNERGQSYENRPYGLAGQEIRKALFPPNHPYHWQTIGSQEHLDAASVEDVKAFFRRFYSPNNASLAIAGDIDVEETKRLVEKYFGDLAPAPSVARIQRRLPRPPGGGRGGGAGGVVGGRPAAAPLPHGGRAAHLRPGRGAAGRGALHPRRRPQLAPLPLAGLREADRARHRRLLPGDGDRRRDAHRRDGRRRRQPP